MSCVFLAAQTEGAQRDPAEATSRCRVRRVASAREFDRYTSSLPEARAPGAVCCVVPWHRRAMEAPQQAQQRTVRRTDDAGSTRLRAEPKEDSAFSIDAVDGEETEVEDGAIVTVLSEATSGFTRILTSDNRDGYILTSYLSMSQDRQVSSSSSSSAAAEEKLMPWEAGYTSTSPNEGIPPAAADLMEPEQAMNSSTELARAPVPEPARAPGQIVQEDEDPDDDTTAHREITRDHLVAMAEVIGLDDDLLDSMLDALDGDLHGTAGMLQEQGSPDPWAALEAKQAKAAAAATKINARSATIPSMSRNNDAQCSNAADTEEQSEAALAEKYLMPAHRHSEALPPTGSSSSSAPAQHCLHEELMAMKPSDLVKRATAVGVDQAVLATARDSEQPREEIVSLILAATTDANAANAPKSRKEQLREYLEPHGFAPFTEAVAAALYAAEVPSKRWLNELTDIEAKGQLPDFLSGIRKTYTAEGVLRSELRSSAAAASRGSNNFSSASTSLRNDAVDTHSQRTTGPAHDDTRSALFAGAKKSADWAASKQGTPGGGGALAPSAKVLEAQQRVRQNLESLGDLSDRTKQMEENSQQFAAMATQLRKKKQFGLF